ncbi:iron ABC transporter periplasmic iron-binding protein [Streptomyces venezuelae]|uniref:iron ABC transporter substrate-binding protein n=1 Tax=Streptomyces gardneri TaxID=66892 RepID=UPI0006BE1415|nr:iron ABC transporter substrate-binding protein [Streptomyces gardneri]ALO05878.1 iron ABC transporter periplasmic iron-binding protein [Streptomyces venezuelae]QPK43402.1 iron ABC transporter substrate-binding protein [Streptomyces gardneri]WRK34628.1 iron ABC transporter substrate-binding protein [Streptomyces venezuelae]CUM43906.1 Ferric iron ABC transporter, iron-binding protein [Streptomyces venezuelae]
MRRPLARTLTAIAAAVLLTPALAACGSDEPADLVIYSGRNENLVKPLIEKLEKHLGANVEVRYGDSAELSAQLMEEGDKTEAGLFLSQDAGALGALSKEKRLAPLPGATLDKVDPAYRGSNGDWTGVSGRVRVLGYHPDQVPTPPNSVHELVKPEWKGKIGFVPTNASFQAFVTGMRVLEGDEAARTWLKGLKANEPKAYENNLKVLEAVDKGEVSLGLLNHYYWYEQVAEKGADKIKAKIHYLPKGDPGGLVNVAGVGILTGADDKQAAYAQKAVDYLLSAEAQTYFAQETKEYPLAADVKTAEGVPPLETLQPPKIDLGRLDSLKETLAMLQEVGLV